jgi:hypothetical protein
MKSVFNDSADATKMPKISSKDPCPLELWVSRLPGRQNAGNELTGT